MPVSWKVEEGALILPVEDAEWWGASLAVLVAAIHHPQLLRVKQPEADVDDVARNVLDGLVDLKEAADAADDMTGRDATMPALVRREGEAIIIEPGVEARHLAFCLEIFARAVLSPRSGCALTARGATAYAASAWSQSIGLAAETLGGARDG